MRIKELKQELVKEERNPKMNELTELKKIGQEWKKMRMTKLLKQTDRRRRKGYGNII